MEEYLNTLLEQIRCEKAHDMVRTEIRGHIEDQIEENLSFGMPYEAAVKEAIRDMGDPVETGVSLDRIHRPQMAWNMVFMMAIISIASILIQFQLAKGNPEFSYFFSRHVVYTIFGFFMMLAVYRIDYSILGKYGKWIGMGFLALLFLMPYGFGTTFNGSTRFLFIFGSSVSLSSIMYLFLPIYGAILYQYRGSGYKGIFKSILWMLPTIIFALQMPNFVLALSLFFMMALLLSIAVYKNWFQIKKLRFLISFWGIIFTFPVTLLALALKFNWLYEYQKLRLLAFFDRSNYGYISETLRKCIQNSKMLGFSGEIITDDALMYTSDYVLTSITSYYGFLIAIVIIALMMLLAGKIFSIAFHQKNQLGMIVGYACGIVFATVTCFNILRSFGILPAGYTTLPFFSYGGSTNVVFYMLIGLVLSIYRYKNILPNKIRLKKVSVD